MIYEYNCPKCDSTFDVVKKVAEIDRAEPCPQCYNPDTDRVFNPKIYFNNASVEDAYYNHGLGQVVKNRAQAKELAERKGLVEIGTETPETIHKESAVKAAERREKEWNDL